MSSALFVGSNERGVLPGQQTGRINSPRKNVERKRAGGILDAG